MVRTSPLLSLIIKIELIKFYVMRTSIFNNPLNDREKLYFSILRTVKKIKEERVGSLELNRFNHFSQI